jgi:hypothetical protein
LLGILKGRNKRELAVPEHLTQAEQHEMFDMFEAGIDMDGISGVVINPYGESVRLNKELLGIIMESFEKYKQYRDEQQKHCQ